MFTIYHRSFVNQDLIKEGETILPQIVSSYLSTSLPFAPQDCIQ